MKKILSLLVMIFMATQMLVAQNIDPTKRPEPLKGKDFKFPDYTTKTLSNGVKVFIIEDHEQPTVSFSLLIPGGSSVQGAKAGLADFMTTLLTKGTTTKTALEIAQKMDGIGASVGAGASVDYFNVSGGGLTKYTDDILEMMADVLTNPTFPQEEFDKLLPQAIQGLESEKANSGSIAAALTRKALYGEYHPYSIKETKETLESIKIRDIKELYRTWMKPNNATMAVIGDVKADEIVAKLENAFKGWEKGFVPEILVPKAQPMPRGVYFVNRPGSVQSSVIVSTPAIPYADKDYDAADFAARIIGTGFGGRLFRTLRETHSYTYTPFGYMTGSKYVNRFACGADVRSSVTDSAIVVINEQLKDLCTNPPGEEELKRIKNFRVGTFLMAFESAGTMASLVQRADFMGISMDRYENYTNFITNLAPEKIRDVAAKYLNPKDEYIIVVGDPEVKESLKKFGKIYEYDLDLNPIKTEQVSIKPEELIAKYTEAIGGQDKLDAVANLKMEGKGSMSMQGQSIPFKIEQLTTNDKKQYVIQDLGMYGKMKVMTDGKKAWQPSRTVQGKYDELSASEAKEMIDGLEIFEAKELLNNIKNISVTGKQGDHIVLEEVSTKGSKSYYYFNATTFLLEKTESSSEQGSQSQEMKEYKNFNGIMLPTKLSQQSGPRSIELEVSYEINIKVEDSMFRPE